MPKSNKAIVYKREREQMFVLDLTFNPPAYVNQRQAVNVAANGWDFWRKQKQKLKIKSR